jgi:hypothetical protein
VAQTSWIHAKNTTGRFEKLPSARREVTPALQNEPGLDSAFSSRAWRHRDMNSRNTTLYNADLQETFHFFLID